MNKMIFLKCNIKKVFCIFLLLMALLLLIFIILFNPKKNNVSYLFDTSKQSSVKRLPSEVSQQIVLDVNNITSMNIFFEDDSIIDCSFNVNIYDNKKIIFSNNFKKYNSNVLYLPVGYLDNIKNHKLKIDIIFNDCEGINASLITPVNKYNHINGDNNSTLKIAVNSLSRNNNYYWYVIVIVTIALILLPVSRGKK